MLPGTVILNTSTRTLELVSAVCLSVGIIIAGLLFLKYKRCKTDLSTENKTLKGGFLFKLEGGDNNDFLSKLGDDVEEKLEQKLKHQSSLLHLVLFVVM